MATPQKIASGNPSLHARLSEARANTDALFKLLSPNSFYDRPIPERHRLIFYLGHVEAFDWNLLAPVLALVPGSPEFDRLFAFGIDPVGGNLPTDKPADWPHIAQVESYNRRTREKLDEALERAEFSAQDKDGNSFETLLHVAIEHRLMHAETLAYLLHNLPAEKLLHRGMTEGERRPAPKRRRLGVPRGFATLGQQRGAAGKFGWDNEFEEMRFDVPEFSIDEFPVTNGDFLAFINAGGYSEPGLWKPENWVWKEKAGISHPHLWVRGHESSRPPEESNWMQRTMFGMAPLPKSWPVYVSHAEASAYVKWAGARLPSEAEWHRAAYGSADGSEREFPWGYAPPEATKGNFNFENWDACPVDAHPAGASAFGVQDLAGNGWEWTSTVFGPLAGFEPFSFYRGYSADFFDGRHFVMKGGSARTDASMLRRSFRNWFQPHYPFVYATFRCVES
ncbi:MAG TPA: SUMF1/EgtB/PvdO family nonheme iron enzyme [Verrucomicrobiae bacterium]|nr:SUMF1/EgtB/PvdO family nonheme iron enzyme [Verrucomicrobiae bacterium]